MITACKELCYEEKEKPSTLQKLFGSQPTKKNVVEKIRENEEFVKNEEGAITSSFRCI